MSVLKLAAWLSAAVLTVTALHWRVSAGEATDRKLNQTQSEIGATVAGVVTFHGESPKAREQDASGAHQDLLEVNRETRGLRHVVAYLVAKTSSSVARSNSIGKSPAAPLKPVTIDQNDGIFMPHLIAVQSGQTVRFTNSDTGNHNVRAASLVPGNEFNVFTGNGGEYKHRFQADANQRPVRLGCDIHPWMRAWIFVFDHPYFAVTDDRGRFSISSVPPGQYELVVRQPDMGYVNQQKVTLTANQTARVEVQIKAEELKGF